MYPTHLNGLSERRIEGLSREEICRKYQRKILLLSRRISERLPPGCELGGEDLASFGAIGLLEAFDRFDENRDIQFTTFAEYRIRGAMMDALRATDTFTRHRRQVAKEVVEAERSSQVNWDGRRKRSSRQSTRHGPRHLLAHDGPREARQSRSDRCIRRARRQR